MEAQTRETKGLLGLLGEEETTASRDGQGVEDDFHNARQPAYAIASERPEHRICIYLKAQGLSNIEIGKRMEKTPVWVAYVVKQPWARERIAQEIRQAGRDTLQGLLQGEAENSLWTLVEIRDDISDKTRSSDRINASNSLLDRLLGKPNQPISHSGKVDVSTFSDEDLVAMLQPQVN